MREIIPGKRTKGKGDITLKHNDEELEREKVAEFINQYFVNVGSQTPGDLMGTPLSDPTGTIELATDNQRINEHVDLATSRDELLSDCNPLSKSMEAFAIDPIINEEVLRLVKSINTSKSSGITNLSSKLLKEAFLVLTKHLTFLFNLSLGNLLYPDDWKQALVVPIPKQGDSHSVSNYRPISLLPLPGKILEKLVHSQLSNYLEENDLLEDNQFGFRKERSTMHAASSLIIISTLA